MSSSESIRGSPGSGRSQESGRVGTDRKGKQRKLQATILKKSDRKYHRPQTNKQRVGGTCQHTCEPSAIERCRHAWTVRYTVNGVQRDKSFRDEIDARKRVQWGTWLKKAQDFQLELTWGKRTQSKTYVDPKASKVGISPTYSIFTSNRGDPCEGKRTVGGTCEKMGPRRPWSLAVSATSPRSGAVKGSWCLRWSRPSGSLQF